MIQATSAELQADKASPCACPFIPLLYLHPMAIYAIKRSNESNDSLQQRFKKQVQKTGILKMLRERHVHRRKMSKRLQRIRALKREEIRTENCKKQFYSNM